MRGFLYGQTEYNMLKNAMHLDDYIAYGKQYEYPFLSLTDSNMYACYKFYTACRKNGIKPVIGIEYISTEGDVFLCYAKTEIGFKSLLHISSKIRAMGEVPNLEFLFQTQNDLAIVLVATKSIASRRSIMEQERILKEYKDRFHSFYVGIALQQHQEIDSNLEVMQTCIKNNIPCVPLHRTLYLEIDDFDVYNALCDISNSAEKIDPFDDFSFPKNLNEFNEYPNLSVELEKLIKSIDLVIFQNQSALPHFPNAHNVSSKDYLYGLCVKGLEKRLYLGGISIKEPYYERLAFELGVIDKMGYNDYFLIVWEFIKYAKQSDILVGPGRGSAAGSLVAYTLGITEVDPLKYNLLFERFLNPERITMPDIDTDFPDDKRDIVINHVKDFYGSTHVCNISAYGTFQIKSSIRDLARVWKWDFDLINELVEIGTTKTFDEISEMFKGREDILKLFRISKKLENLPRHISTHAAGIILSGEELMDVIPLQEGINGLYQSQLEASDLEKIGMLKMDFLGIRNLQMIDEMIKLIPGFTKRKLYDLSLTDTKTYQMLQKADTLGIFQLESSGIRQVLLKLKPICFEDLVAVLALYRPGPMDNIDEFIQRNHGKPFTYIHPSLKEILAPTYGIIVYQEQIMQILQLCGNYSLAEADLLRRAISKKNEEVLQIERKRFVERTINNGYTLNTANEVYDYIVKFANYGFNRSHSVAYAMVSFQMAYLKANYFPLFMSNVLNNVLGSRNMLKEYITYANEHDLKICKPNINISTTKCVTTPNGIFLPLTSIFGLGEVAARQIIKERTSGLFLSFDDFKLRCSGFINSNIMDGLIYSGALDLFSRSKKEMIEDKEAYQAIIDKHLDGVIHTNQEFDEEYLAEMEEKYLGFNLEHSPFRNLVELRMKHRYKTISDAKLDSNIVFFAKFVNLKTIKTKAGKMMIVGSVIDDTAKKKMVIFSREFDQFADLVNEKNMYEIVGKVMINQKNQEEQIVISSLKIVLKP